MCNCVTIWLMCPCSAGLWTSRGRSHIYCAHLQRWSSINICWINEWMLREEGSGAVRERKEAEKEVADILGCHEWPGRGEGLNLGKGQTYWSSMSLMSSSSVLWFEVVHMQGWEGELPSWARECWWEMLSQLWWQGWGFCASIQPKLGPLKTVELLKHYVLELS